MVKTINLFSENALCAVLWKHVQCMLFGQWYALVAKMEMAFTGLRQPCKEGIQIPASSVYR